MAHLANDQARTSHFLEQAGASQVAHGEGIDAHLAGSCAGQNDDRIIVAHSLRIGPSARLPSPTEPILYAERAIHAAQSV